MDDPIYDRVALCDGEGSRCATGRGRTLRRVGVALCDPALIRYIVVPGRKDDFIDTYWSAFERERILFTDAQGNPAFPAA